MGFGRDQAETIAQKALAWLAGNEDLLPQFLGASGLGPDELAARAAEPEPRDQPHHEPAAPPAALTRFPDDVGPNPT